ncbi:hypothetical protein [Aquimarina mytili]|uniref:Uncharacterized protein n=1 Tax=Aquimarina mytili TaxID=874423 RepID=A0A937A241_9FLAO|nr:hypothetical protein [Aquimarina mytili]MBL0683600.1 hypothetical protein [Aquimarina mytili]
MILGTLTLQQKRGVFYKEIQVASEDRFSEIENKELRGIVTPSDHKTTEIFRVTPVDESGNSDYINAIFEDDGKVNYPYEVTVWLLIESDAQPVMGI